MRYGIQDDIQADIQDGFLGHVEMWLPDAAHGLPAGSDTISRPFPLFWAVGWLRIIRDRRRRV